VIKTSEKKKKEKRTRVGDTGGTKLFLYIGKKPSLGSMKKWGKTSSIFG
jgi:hypothetical protein